MSKRSVWIGAGTLSILVIAGTIAFLQRPTTVVAQAPQAESPRPPEAVAALGRLRPLGEIRRLAAPVSGFGGTPRVSKLLVNEGDTVTRGQVLAVFDSRPQIEADLEALDAQIRTIETEIPLRRREVARYAEAAKVGAASMVILEEKQNELTLAERKRIELIAERRSLEADLVDSELRSPIDGTVLRLHTRVGERPSNDGVLEVGASQSMEALIEVYESDINRIAVGDPVTLVSENGGFEGRLTGRVERVSPQVRQREVLSTNPTGDADARVVEVQVSLDRDSARRVSSLAGLKVIARFKTS
ncbi:ABC exporter membrane fusion/ DevB family [Synechococcus sp. PROS-7-1]|uniref:HlyD family efflux transporter periplasmic adaptor subunit n=1 Tax=Synechococcus sp. PROS-7-1 TaxID=1442556 RepID=UPI00164544BA|nr:HlyD family efflux transporter periplasmic adaptor subunit [Synechococcus sp. PROS-7-1]QNI85330.1 ABC exporter membrane fusion/ DevB family [Synechococcus sp. PROS-7-1]